MSLILKHIYIYTVYVYINIYGGLFGIHARRKAVAGGRTLRT